MPESQQPKRDVLGYASPHSEQDLAKPANPVEAVLLCLPGLICWIIFLGSISGVLFRWLRFPRLRLTIPIVLILWFVAVVTAIASFASYAGRNKGQRSWYVWLNLILNGAGLLFTTVVVILLFIGLFGALMKM